jgi:hypothetical protein
MKGQDKETVLVRIGDAWIDRDDMDCLFLDDVQVNNGAVSMFNNPFTLIN